MLIRLSTEQRPLFTQTANGGKMMAMMPRQISEPHMIDLCDEVIPYVRESMCAVRRVCEGAASRCVSKLPENMGA